MSRQSELLRRAAECERLIALASDPKKKLIFKRLRDTWIVLANHSPNLSREDMATDIAAIEEIQFLFEEGVRETS